MDKSNLVGQDIFRAQLACPLAQFQTETHTRTHTNGYSLTNLENSQTTITVLEIFGTKEINQLGDLELESLKRDNRKSKALNLPFASLAINRLTSCKPTPTPYLTTHRTSTDFAITQYTRARRLRLPNSGFKLRLKQLTSMSVVPRQLNSLLGDFFCRNYFLLIYILR